MVLKTDISLLELKASVRELIGEATIQLDAENWKGWLNLCTENFLYSITSFSPEINKDMIYMRMDKKELVDMTDMLPKHNTDHSPLTRHTSVYRVTVDETPGSISAYSAVTVHQHLLDGINSHIDSGESRLFLVGEYLDEFILDENQAPKFKNRELKLRNRRLDKGSHWPI